MVDFTTVNPTTDPFKIGVDINQPCGVGIVIGPISTPVGAGTLKSFSASTIKATGSYKAMGAAGSFDISATPQGDHFKVVIAITGSFAGHSRSFLATAVQVNADLVRLTSLGSPPLVLELAQSDGGMFSDGKIHVQPAWAPAKFYITAKV